MTSLSSAQIIAIGVIAATRHSHWTYLHGLYTLDPAWPDVDKIRPEWRTLRPGMVTALRKRGLVEVLELRREQMFKLSLTNHGINTLYELDEALRPATVERAKAVGLPRGGRESMPSRRVGWTQKVHVGGHKLFLQVGEYPDGRLGEVFLTAGNRDSSALRAMMNCFAMAVSLMLQHGVPMDTVLELFEGYRFEPSGPVVGSEAVTEAKSIVDYVMKELRAAYMPGTAHRGETLPGPEDPIGPLGPMS